MYTLKYTEEEYKSEIEKELGIKKEEIRSIYIIHPTQTG